MVPCYAFLRGRPPALRPSIVHSGVGSGLGVVADGAAAAAAAAALALDSARIARPCSSSERVSAEKSSSRSQGSEATTRSRYSRTPTEAPRTDCSARTCSGLFWLCNEIAHAPHRTHRSSWLAPAPTGRACVQMRYASSR
jgi:hypothetical protein